jgi:hypothetical protein
MELFRKIIVVDLTNQALKPNEKNRKQPARGADKWIGQTFTDDGEMFEVTGTSIVKGQKVVDYINEKGKDYYSNMEEVKECQRKKKEKKVKTYKFITVLYCYNNYVYL